MPSCRRSGVAGSRPQLADVDAGVLSDTGTGSASNDTRTWRLGSDVPRCSSAAVGMDGPFLTATASGPSLADLVANRCNGVHASPTAVPGSRFPAPRLVDQCPGARGSESGQCVSERTLSHPQRLAWRSATDEVKAPMSLMIMEWSTAAMVPKSYGSGADRGLAVIVGRLF